MLRRCSLLLLVLGSIACRQPPATLDVPKPAPDPAEPEPEPDAGKPALREPACPASLGPDGEVLVGGAPSGLLGSVEPPVRIASFGWDENTILLAVGTSTPWWPWSLADGVRSDRLWRVPCAAPDRRAIELQIDGADFAWATLAPDGSALYFSRGGVQRYDFVADDFGPVGERPGIEPCWMSERPVEAVEYVVGWVGADALLIYSGGPCGFEAEFEGGSVVIDDPAGAAERRPLGFVGTVAADAGGRAWAGDGGRCSEQQTLWDRGWPGVWRSDDAGASWEQVAIPGIDTGIEAIWTSADDPDALLVRAACCYGSAADTCFGGELLRSDDGGRSFIEVTPKGDYEARALRVGPQLRELELSIYAILDGELETLISHDGGRTWTSGPARELEQSPISRRVELGEHVLEAWIDGLLRRRLDAPAGTGEVVLRPAGAGVSTSK